MLISISSPLDGQHILVEPIEFKELINDSVFQKLDVRSELEYDAIGHIGGFEQISILDKKFESKILKKFDATQPILVTCFSGHRSNTAVEKLEKLGFKKIYELKGGLINWMNKGYRLE